MCSPHCDLLGHRARHSFPVCLGAQQEPMTGEAHVHKSFTRTIRNAAAQAVHPHGRPLTSLGHIISQTHKVGGKALLP